MAEDDTNLLRALVTEYLQKVAPETARDFQSSQSSPPARASVRLEDVVQHFSRTAPSRVNQLDSSSLWEFLVKKTVSKRLGTAESLQSLLSEMQAAVMELKNMAEQCLSQEKPEEGSLSVSLTPIMSSVLGLSQTGGVSRYILPQDQIPAHYHQLLSLPTRVKTSIKSTQTSSSIIQPQEEISLEDNLGVNSVSPLTEASRGRGQELERPGPGEGPSNQAVTEDVLEIRGGVTNTLPGRSVLVSPQESDGASQIAAHTRRYSPATTGTSSPPEDSRVVVSPDNMEAGKNSSGKIIPHLHCYTIDIAC